MAQRLGKRLEMAAELVPECSVAADIGCDHGKLAYQLENSGRAKHVIACDISLPSLKKAEALGLETRLGDGLAPLEAGEAECVIIAGMGGLLTSEIIERGREKLRGAALVLLPAQQTDRLRGYLRTCGFIITDEALAYEAGRFYACILAKEGITPPLDGKSALLYDIAGPVLLKKRPEGYEDYIKKLLDGCAGAINAVEGETPAALASKKALESKASLLEELLNEIRN